MRKLIFIIYMAISPGACRANTQASPSPDLVRHEEVLGMASAVHFFSDHVARNNTTQAPVIVVRYMAESNVQYLDSPYFRTRLNKDLPGLKEETLSSFVERQLIPDTALALDVEQVVRRMGVSDSPRRLGPPHFLVISRIGFDRKLSQGLLSYSYSCGAWCGERGFLVLRKREGKWYVEGKANNDISPVI